MFALVYKQFVCAKRLEKQKTKAKPHGVVYSLWYVIKYIPGGVVYKGVNAPCITVLYLALKFHKALLSLHKALFTP